MRPLNNRARYNDVDFTRLKANLSNTGHFALNVTFFPSMATPMASVQSLQYSLIASGITDPKQKRTVILHLAAQWYGGRGGGGRDFPPPVNSSEFLAR